MVSAGACVGSSKSANPLSPAIAGPIAGVGITAPTVVAPAIDALVNTTTQPITLQVGNADDQRRAAADLHGSRSPPIPASRIWFRARQRSAGRERAHQRDAAAALAARAEVLLARARRGRREYRRSSARRARSACSRRSSSAHRCSSRPSTTRLTTSSQPRLVIGNASRSGPVERVYYYIEISSSSNLTPLTGALHGCRNAEARPS